MRSAMTNPDFPREIAGAGRHRVLAILTAIAASGAAAPAFAQAPNAAATEGMKIDDAFVAFGRAFVVGHTDDPGIRVTAPTYGVRTKIERLDLEGVVARLEGVLGTVEGLVAGKESDLATTLSNLRVLTENLRALSEAVKSQPSARLFGAPPKPGHSKP